MPRSLFLLCAFLVNADSDAQWWADAGLPVDGPNYLSLYVDSSSNTLLASGNIVDNAGTPEQAMHYCSYQDGSWTVSEPFNHFVLTALVHQDTLYVGGAFSSAGGVPVSYVARKVNGMWTSAGSFDNVVYRLKELDGELYAIGDFTYADGSLCQGIAKYTSSGWESILPLDCDNCLLKDAVMYDGELVVSGTITFPGNPYRHVMRLHNGEWLPLGEQGIDGSLSAGGPLAVFEGHLFVGGLIDINSGNAGHAVMRWNGSAWSSVGSGVQDELGGYGQLIRVDDLEVHNGLLFASGGFTYAGNVPANRIATWNGSEWCSVGGDFGDWAVNSIAFLNDTLFAACWDVADGQPVNHLVKFIAPAYEGNCSIPMAVDASSAAPIKLDALGDGRYRMPGLAGRHSAALYSPIGQLCFTLVMDGEAPFSIPATMPGVHVLHVQGAGVYQLLVRP